MPLTDVNQRIEAAKASKMHSADRILVLQPIEGKHTISSGGLIDNRLFTGENKLHAMMDTQTCLWYFKYESGVLPSTLKQQFTGFNRLYKFATDYFKRRNIDIVEVQEVNG